MRLGVFGMPGTLVSFWLVDASSNLYLRAFGNKQALVPYHHHGILAISAGEDVPEEIVPRAHIFYENRVVDVRPDGIILEGST